jgi:hypothetical protein
MNSCHAQSCCTPSNFTVGWAPLFVSWQMHFEGTNVLRRIPSGHTEVSLTATDFTQQSPSWKAKSSSGTSEIPRILRKPKIHYCVHKIPPVEPDQSSPRPHKIFFNILILSSHQRLGLPNDLVPSGFSTKTMSDVIYYKFKLPFLTRKSRLQTRRPNILTKSFRCLPQCLQANAWIRFLPRPF